MEPVKTLTVDVYVRKGNGTVRFVTDVEIRLGSLIVAMGTLGGRYSREQALKEFNKSRNRFKIINRFGFEAAQGLGLCA